MKIGIALSKASCCLIPQRQIVCHSAARFLTCAYSHLHSSACRNSLKFRILFEEFFRFRACFSKLLLDVKLFSNTTIWGSGRTEKLNKMMRKYVQNMCRKNITQQTKDECTAKSSNDNKQMLALRLSHKRSLRTCAMYTSICKRHRFHHGFLVDFHSWENTVIHTVQDARRVQGGNAQMRSCSNDRHCWFNNVD